MACAKSSVVRNALWQNVGIASAVRILILFCHNAQLRMDTLGLGNYITIVHGQGILF